jgi:hypothetical protein
MGTGPKYAQTDFSGGLNTHPLQAPNELQVCTNLDLEDMGAARPAYTDKLLVSKSSVDSVWQLDDYLYYNSGTTLFRAEKDGSNETSLGTIGAGTFKATKDQEIVIIQASNKFYKVIGTTLEPLGVAAPASGTFSLARDPSPLLAVTIKSCAAGDAFTVSNCTVANDAVNFATGANSKAFTIATPGLLSTAKDTTLSLNLTSFAAAGSTDDDLITFWVFVTAVDGLDYIKLIFELGDDQNTYSKIVPVTPFAVQADTDEDNASTFADYDRDKIDWDEEYTNWSQQFDPNTRAEFDKFYVSKSDTLGPITTERKFRKRIPGIEQQWVQIKIPKSEFVRNGDDTTAGWSTVSSVTLQFVTTIPNVVVNIDTIQLEGGGELDRDRYKVSFAYVDQTTLSDGSVYEEVSQLSEEVELTGVFRNNIQITTVAPETVPSNADIKRFYIRGGGLLLRHEIGDVDASLSGSVVLTTTDNEEALAINPLEDSNKNGIAPLEATDSLIHGGRLYVLKDKTLSWSRPLKLSAFRPNDNLLLPDTGVGLMSRGANVVVLTSKGEVIYVNPGATAADGGYLHYPDNPHGCVAPLSANEGYYASYEGVNFFTGGSPVVMSDRIRQDYLALTGRASFVAGFTRGRYYLCSPDDGVTYEYDSTSDRWLKHDDTLFINAGDDGNVYTVKSGGIYLFQGDTQNRKAFTYRSPEIVIAEDEQFRHVVVDAHYGDGMDVEYFVNGTSKTTFAGQTSTARERKEFPITQEPGNRISVKISSGSVATDTDKAIYGVWLK